MPSAPPPNTELVELSALLGEDNVRMLVRTFLREFPASLSQLPDADRKTRHRIAHSLKSNARVIGARALSARMEAIERRLSSETGRDLDAPEIAEIAKDFDQIASSLRPFAGE